jgi:hypothetical protein
MYLLIRVSTPLFNALVVRLKLQLIELNAVLQSYYTQGCHENIEVLMATDIFVSNFKFSTNDLATFTRYSERQIKFLKNHKL